MIIKAGTTVRLLETINHAELKTPAGEEGTVIGKSNILFDSPQYIVSFNTASGVVIALTESQFEVIS